MRTRKIQNFFISLLLMTLIIPWASGDASAEEQVPGPKDEGAFWGKPTNFLRAGLSCSENQIRIDSKTGLVLTKNCLAIGNVTSNQVDFIWPSPECYLSLTLVNSNGFQVKRTAEGEKLGTSINSTQLPKVTQFKKRGFSFGWLTPYENMFFNDHLHPLEHFNPARYFILTNCPGEYKMKAEMHVCFADTNGNLKFTTLPPLFVNVRVER